MFASELAAVSALENKASELVVKTHWARAAEKRAAAVAAAQALGYTDCLITAWLQANLASLYISHAFTSASADVDVEAALRSALLVLHAAVETLKRRKAAGTLLAGACRPIEIAWYDSKIQSKVRSEGVADFASAWRGCFIGYDAYLAAASALLTYCQYLDSFDFAAELTDFVVSAIDLVMQPRAHPTKRGPEELAFACRLEVFAESAAPLGASARRQVIVDAWGRLQRSRVLRERDIDEATKRVASAFGSDCAAAQARAASAVLRCCALEACAAREAHPAHFSRCAACKAVVYCCREHQVQDWPAHKKACKAARQAAAALKGGGGSSA